MNGVRVLRVSHSAVVPEYRERDRLLRERHGYDVHVVAPPEWPEGGSVVRAQPDGRGPLHIVPVRGLKHPILFWYDPRGLRRVLREVRPQLVDLHEEPYSLAAWRALRLVDRDVPVCIYTAQNVYKRYPPPFGRVEQSVLRRVSAAYPCSTEAAGVLLAKGFRGRSEVMPLGVTVEGARPERTSGLRVGFVGRLVPVKGADLALRAFAPAAAGLDVSLEIVGSGPEEPALRELAARLGLDDRVVFRGAVSQEEALGRMRSFDVLVVPSRSRPGAREQFGRVAAQAFAAGTPVLATASGSLPGLVGDCGELVPEDDEHALAAALSALLRDRGRRERLAERGRALAEAELSWERVADRMDAMYRAVLGLG